MYVALTVAGAGYMSASGRSCDRPSQHRFCLVSLCLSISECWDGSLYSKLLLHASHVAHQDQTKPPKFMFVMFDMYVKLPPEASPIAVNKCYLLTYDSDKCRFILIILRQLLTINKPYINI